MTDLRAAARAALARPRFKRLIAAIPAAERDNPRALLSWLTTAAELDPKGADTAEYNAAYASLKSLADAEDLYARAVRLYHDPKIRAEFGVEAVERAWNDPATARELLLQKGKLSPEADAALDLIYEAETIAAEHDQAWPRPAEAPLPTDATARETEIRVLLDKSAAGTLTAADDRRLDALYAARIALEQDAEDREVAAYRRGEQPPPLRGQTERQRLIDRSLDGTITAAEIARLDSIIESGLIADGTIEKAADNGDYRIAESAGITGDEDE